MSVLIRGMTMPKNCDVCMFSDWSNLHQTAACKICEYDPCFDNFSREYLSKRANFCPLAEVKSPHGRLIDADSMISQLMQIKSNAEKEPNNLDLYAIGFAVGIVDQQFVVVDKEDN